MSASELNQSQITLHQGAIENIFLDSLREHGVKVDRPMQPMSLELSMDEAKLADPQSYPVKVGSVAIT